MRKVAGYLHECPAIDEFELLHHCTITVQGEPDCWWVRCVWGDMMQIRVTHCPYCGVKLDEESEGEP